MSKSPETLFLSSFKLIAITYGIEDTCVAHPRDCPCPIPEEQKCALGKDAYICVRKELFLSLPAVSK